MVGQNVYMIVNGRVQWENNCFMSNFERSNNSIFVL